MAGFSTSSVDLLVVDEAHRIQNPKAKQSVAVAGVGMAASARILVTATPLANNLAEFGALLQHAQPGLLGDVTGFDACFAQPFEAGRARGASEQAKAAMRLAADGVKQLRESLTLRRTRAQLQKASGCPQITAHVYILVHRLQQHERDIYEELARGGGDAESRKPALARLTMLKNLLLHPEMLRDKAVSGPVVDRAIPFFPERKTAPRPLAHLSTKLQVVLALVDEIVSTMGDRVVVASYSVVVLDYLAASLRATFGPAAVCKLAGGASGQMQMINDFNTGSTVKVFLLSALMAPGLTLVGANHLIALEPHWNPARDTQLLGRIVREGQTALACHHYRLAAGGTIEELGAPLALEPAPRRALSTCVSRLTARLCSACAVLERQGVRKSELCALLYANELPARELPDECTDERDLFFALDPAELGSRLVRRLSSEGIADDAVGTAPTDAATAATDGATAAAAVAATASPAATAGAAGTADAPESAVAPAVTPVTIAAASIDLFHTTWEVHCLDGQPLDAGASQPWGNPALVTLAGSRAVGLSVSSETPPAAPEADADGECDDTDDALGEDSQLAFAVARPLLLSNILYTEGLPVWQPDTKREF